MRALLSLVSKLSSVQSMGKYQELTNRYFSLQYTHECHLTLTLSLSLYAEGRREQLGVLPTLMTLSLC